MNKNYLEKMLLLMIILFITSIPFYADTINIAAIEGSQLHMASKKLLIEIYKRAGISIEIFDLPSKRAIMESSSGKKDGELIRIFNFGNVYPQLIRVPTPYTYFELAVFSKDQDLIISGWKSLDNYRVGKVRGIKAIDDNLSGLGAVYETGTDIQLFKMLESGRIDIAISSAFEGLCRIKQLKLSSRKIVPVLENYDGYHYLHEDNKDLIPKLDKVIKSMKESGELELLREKFLKEYLDNLN